MQRDRSLDSLRGLAAGSVLLYHVLLTNSDSLNAGTYGLPVEGHAANLLVYTPLHIAWLGAEAVWFFFILSGFVLTRAANKPTFSWTAYFPSRIVRLYVPVIAAVALAWLSYNLASTFTAPNSEAPFAYAPEWVMKDVLLLGGTSTFMGVLWSLQWEVIFSLALPLYILLVRQHRVGATIVAIVTCLLGFFVNVQGSSVLPMFFFGALLAQQWDWVVARFQFLATRTVSAHLWACGLTIGSVLGMTSFFLAGRWLESIDMHARTVTTPVVLASICMLIVLSMLWPPMRSLLGMRPLVFVGKMSYSLYLVHLPIVIILANLLPRGISTVVLSVVLSLLMGCLFYFAVEKPSHALARRVAARQREPYQEPVRQIASSR